MHQWAKKLTLSVGVLIVFASGATALASAKGDFPVSPDTQMTPGDLCREPDAFRYPEHIPYCNRDVRSDEKNEIIRAYDETFSYRIREIGRQHFKIDHFIPLCMGGSNDVKTFGPSMRASTATPTPLSPNFAIKWHSAT